MNFIGTIPGTYAQALTFVRPFNAAKPNQRRLFWQPPAAESYEAACAIGADCGQQLVTYLRADRDTGDALLIWTLNDVFSGKATAIDHGYRAGLVAQLARGVSGRPLLSYGG